MEEDHFYSVNKLVEFGMGISIAQQMVKAMNESISGMNSTGKIQSNSSQPSLFYLIIDDLQTGPLSEIEIVQLFSTKKINKTTYFWKPGMTQWLIAEKIPEILKLIALTPPPFTEDYDNK